MKKKSFIVILIILVAIILGLCVFIAYDKNLFGIKGEKKESSNTVEKKEDTNTTKEVDINSELVKNLVYPKSNSTLATAYPSEYIGELIYEQNTYSNFLLKDENVGAYDLATKVAASLNTSNYTSEEVTCYYIYNSEFSLQPRDNMHAGICGKTSEEVLKKDLTKVFGPDTEYYSGNLKETYCGYPTYYDTNTKSYYGIHACGSGGVDLVKPILKTYKAETDGEYLYVYDYALINYLLAGPDTKIALVFDSYDAYQKYENTKSTESAVASVTSEKEAQSKLEELINSGKANTYIWTFKKQSDGKYYYYSSKWQ